LRGSSRTSPARRVECGLVAALIALAITVRAASPDNALNNKFSSIGTALTNSGKQCFEPEAVRALKGRRKPRKGR
jgi:Flp pilus assembly pilin Flp